MAVTNVFSILLIIMTCISYVPQYYRLVTLRSSAGLSVTGTFFHALVAQFQVATMYIFFKSSPLMRYGVPIATPPSTRDWLNLTQILVQYICALLLLALVIVLPSSGHGTSVSSSASFGYDPMSKRVAVLLWVVSVVSFTPLLAGGRPDDVAFNLMRNIHISISNPIFTLLGAAAISLQASVSLPARDLGVLSTATLGLQSVTFLFLAISWPFRLILAPNMWDPQEHLALLLKWYPWVGWACVNNAIVAIGQGAMLIAIGRGSGRNILATGEVRPLLGPRDE